MKRIIFRLFSVILLVTLSVSTSRSQVLYSFRGEDRTGIYKETGLLKEWPAGGPALVCGKGNWSIPGSSCNR